MADASACRILYNIAGDLSRHLDEGTSMTALV